jgi:pyocin large subunit-like protein
VRLLAVLLAALLLAGCGGTATKRAAASSVQVGSAPVSTVGFRSAGQLADHYARHGTEFGAVDQSAYLRLAQGLRDAAVGGDVLEIVRDDGVTTRFDRATGAFVAFGDDGVIRTFFRPADGEAYFRRQADR